MRHGLIVSKLITLEHWHRTSMCTCVRRYGDEYADSREEVALLHTGVFASQDMT